MTKKKIGDFKPTVDVSHSHISFSGAQPLFALDSPVKKTAAALVVPAFGYLTAFHMPCEPIGAPQAERSVCKVFARHLPHTETEGAFFAATSTGNVPVTATYVGTATGASSLSATTSVAAITSSS